MEFLFFQLKEAFAESIDDVNYIRDEETGEKFTKDDDITKIVEGHRLTVVPFHLLKTSSSKVRRERLYVTIPDTPAWQKRLKARDCARKSLKHFNELYPSDPVSLSTFVVPAADSGGWQHYGDCANCELGRYFTSMKKKTAEQLFTKLLAVQGKKTCEPRDGLSEAVKELGIAEKTFLESKFTSDLIDFKMFEEAFEPAPADLENYSPPIYIWVETPSGQRLKKEIPPKMQVGHSFSFRYDPKYLVSESQGSKAADFEEMVVANRDEKFGPKLRGETHKSARPSKRERF